MKNTPRLFVALLLLVGVPQLAQAQAAPASGSGNKPAVGVAVTGGSFGVGLAAAVRVHEKVNIRGQFNFFSFSHDFENTDDNITFNGDLKMRSINAYVDYFPFGGGFHISPMFQLSNTSKVTLASTIAGGKTFDVDDVSYMSSPSNPVKVAGGVSLKSGKPGVVLGWGNIAGHRRVTVPFELGVVFSSAPVATMSFTGTICQTNGSNCRDAGNDATFQSRVRAEEADLNDTIKPFRFYPVLTLGVGFRF
jgi:hypothetical protein